MANDSGLLSSMVGLSVCVLVRFVSLAKTAEPIEIPFWAEMTMGQEITGYGTNGSTILDGSRGSRVRSPEPKTHNYFSGREKTFNCNKREKLRLFGYLRNNCGNYLSRVNAKSIATLYFKAISLLYA